MFGTIHGPHCLEILYNFQIHGSTFYAGNSHECDFDFLGLFLIILFFRLCSM